MYQKPSPCGCATTQHHAAHGHSMRHGGMHRRYVSPQEEREMIERYLEDLKKEIAGAEARLAELA